MMGSSRPKIISWDSSRRSDDAWRKDFEYALDISLLRIEWELLSIIENMLRSLTVKSAGQHDGTKYGMYLYVPIIEKKICVPMRLLETATVDRSNAIIDAVDTELVWPKSHDGSVSLMRSKEAPIFYAFVSSPQDPQGGER